MPQWKLDRVLDGLHQARQDWRQQQHRLQEFGGRELPSKDVLKNIMDDVCGILFPMRLGPADLHQEAEDHYIAYTLAKVMSQLYQQVQLALEYESKRQPNQPESSVATQQQQWADAEQIVQEFAETLPQIRRLLDADVTSAYLGDPAAHSVDEVLISYPGIFAIIYHRISHQLYAQVPLISRIISELAHSATGIDIHPGAQIGRGFFIDHGTGVVIGETCIIGERVRIYQTVTLGAKRFEKDADGQLKKAYPRHPIVEDDVVIYAGATILGRITIGHGSIIGGNVWLTQSVEPKSVILQSPSLEQSAQT